MLAKPPKVNIRDNAPWEGDPFGRSAHGERLFSLISTLEDQPYVIALNGDWGTGKSVFVERLAKHFERAAPKIPFVTIDAWASDDADDPLVPFVAALNRKLESVTGKKPQAIRTSLSGTAGKLTIPTASFLANLKFPGAGSAIEAAAAFGQALIEWESQRVGSTERFRQTLTEARDVLTGRRPGERVRPIVVAVDELDRCRPDFSIRALERIKHFFNVQGIVFLIATDSGNLPAAVRSVYGDAVDGERYLRKFFDYEYRLPPPTASQYINVLWTEYGMDSVLPASLSDELLTPEFHNWTQYGSTLKLQKDALDAFEYRHYFATFSAALGLKLRDQAQAFTMLSAHIRTQSANRIRLPVVDVLCVCLRFSDPALFAKLVDGTFDLNHCASSDGSRLASPGLVSISRSLEGKALGHFFSSTERSASIESLGREIQTRRPQGDAANVVPFVRLNHRLERCSFRRNTAYVSALLGLIESFDS